MASVKVAVRVRPMNKREIEMGAKMIIEMEGKKTRIANIKASTVTGEGGRRDAIKDFSFDFSYWSADERSRHYVPQEKVFKDLGSDVLKAAFEGYNACIFAYGQTGSGKTFTMMGNQPASVGLIPRICEGLFSKMRQDQGNHGISYRTEVSYLEIYNERVRDLLRPPVKGQIVHSLRVREHPKEGPYVQGLTKHMVSDYAAIEHLMIQGNTHRATASTHMNDVSSRSHAIFTINFTQAKFDHDMPCETTSKINLVDLAGSERADATKASGDRLKEGANINKSLVTLGSVISGLADFSSTHSAHHKFIPYRDSVLTWLLKDSLGGNAKTIMIAAISPADVNYAETLSTLRYANRAKNIINKPTVNEDPNVKLIRDLRAEIARLKKMISPEDLGEAELAAAKKLSENEARVTELTDLWKDRWRETQKILQEREMALRREGVGIKMDSLLPHLVLVDEDPLSTGITVYHLKEGKTTVGLERTEIKPDIVISGPETEDLHCIFNHENGHVVLDPLNSLCVINGKTITKPSCLYQGDVLILGKNNVYRFNHPRQAAELREKRKDTSFSGPLPLSWSTKFRSETDLVFNKRRGEEDLTRQLEEARSELEKQKQQEAQRIEKARAEFEKQIQEESRRLEETRAELERQRRLHALEVQTVEEARKRIQEFAQKHDQNERERTKKEQEMKNEVETREQETKMQSELVAKTREETEMTKHKSEMEISDLKNTMRMQKEEQLVQLSKDMKRIMELEAEKNGVLEETIRQREELRLKWESKSKNVQTQREKLKDLKRQYREKFNVLEEERREALLEKEQFDMEKQAVFDAIKKNEEVLNSFRHQRELALEIANDDIKNRREMLDLDFMEQRKELYDERKCYEDKISQYEAMIEFAADSLSEAYLKLDQKTREENEKKNKYQELEERLVASVKNSEKELETKRQSFENAAAARERNIKTEENSISEMEYIITKLMEELNNLLGDEKENIHFKLRTEKDKLEEKMSKLALLKKEDLKEREQIVKELEEETNRLEDERESMKETLDQQMELIEGLDDSKQNNLEIVEEDLKEAQSKYNQIKMLLNESKKHVAEIEQKQKRLASKAEAGFLHIANVLEQDLTAKGLQEEVFIVREHKIALKDIEAEGKLQLARKQEKRALESEKLTEEARGLTIVLEELQKMQERTENEYKELQEKFHRERKEESLMMESLIESLRDLEEESLLSQSLSGSEITNERIDNVKSALEGEKERIKAEMEAKIREVEEKQQREIEDIKRQHGEAMIQLEQEKHSLERQKELLEGAMNKEKDQLNRERKELEKERLDDIEGIIRDKEMEIEDLRGKAQMEIEELRDRLYETEREVITLQEKLANLTTIANEDELADGEVMKIMYKDDGEMYHSNLSLNSVSPPHITPPPTPVNRFLQSVNNYRRNQIQIQIPRYILRGLGRNSYHVFEVKITIGSDTWSVFRRYSKFRELHNYMRKINSEVGNLEFPNRRFFGNRAEQFVKARRAQLETYLKAFVALCSSLPDCPISAHNGKCVTKRDLCDFAPFFKQGIFEQTKNYSY